MFQQLVTWIVHTVGHWGYPGIVTLMFLESSFFPFPSEVVVAPAGYLAFQGEMSLGLVILAGTMGSLLGAWFNYWLAVRWGRPFFERHGRYFLISRKSLDRADRFFERHGHISTLVGRLLPGIRQYISLPAGLSRMNLAQFSFFTTLGAGIWVTVLAVAGYMFGQNQAVMMSHVHSLGFILIAFCLVLIVGYLAIRRNTQAKGSLPLSDEDSSSRMMGNEGE